MLLPASPNLWCRPTVIGENVMGILDCVSGLSRVVRHFRSKLSYRACDTLNILQQQACPFGSSARG
jgi:hypothetical protein